MQSIFSLTPERPCPSASNSGNCSIHNLSKFNSTAISSTPIIIPVRFTNRSNKTFPTIKNDGSNRSNLRPVTVSRSEHFPSVSINPNSVPDSSSNLINFDSFMLRRGLGLMHLNLRGLLQKNKLSQTFLLSLNPGLRKVLKTQMSFFYPLFRIRQVPPLH